MCVREIYLISYRRSLKREVSATLQEGTSLSYVCKFAESAKSAESVEFALMSPYAVSLSRNFLAAAFLIQINKWKLLSLNVFFENNL